MEKEKRTKIQFNFRTTEETTMMIESHMAAVNCQSKNEFIEKAIRWYCAKLDGETNEEIVTPELTKAIRAVVQEQNNRLARILYKEAVASSMVARFVAAMAGGDEVDFDRLRAKAVRDVKSANGSLDIRSAFYDEQEAREDL